MCSAIADGVLQLLQHPSQSCAADVHQILRLSALAWLQWHVLLQQCSQATSPALYFCGVVVCLLSCVGLKFAKVGVCCSILIARWTW